MTTTYTVTNRHGAIQIKGASLAEAAIECLTYDGHEYEFRANDQGYVDLYTSNYSRNGSCWNGLSKSIFYGETEAAIFQNVIAQAELFEGCEVWTDAAYATMIADLEGDA